MVLLIHAGGWDEVVMVGVGLVIAWVIIRFTGRGDPGLDEEDAADGDAPSEVSRTADEPPDPAQAQPRGQGGEETR